jgi:hypothetical protein
MTSGGAHDCSIAAQIKAITGDAVVEVGADAIESTFVRGFVGATICSGGVCREGAVLILTPVDGASSRAWA